MLFQSIHHVAIICSNYEKSKYFYVDILGCTIIAENYREERKSYKLDLALPDKRAMIELFSFEKEPFPPNRPSRPEACGLRHLAFRVQSMEETLKFLKSKNVPFEKVRADPYTGKLFTFFADPDDLPLEIVEE